MFDEQLFYKRLVELRTAKDVSARDMSLSIGQSENYINAIENKRAFPSMQVFFYICDYFEISPKATVTNQIHAHTSPAAPTADNPTESSVVFMLQLFLTVLEKIKQNNAEKIRVIPNKTATNGQPSMTRKTINSYVGASAPQMISTALF